MSDLFKAEDIFVVDPNKDYSTDLVGEGKKFKDIAGLARSKVEGDAHITRIERENKELREDLAKRATLDEVMTRISQNKQETPPQGNQPPQGEPPAQGLTKAELEDYVSSKLAEANAERTAQTNFGSVVAELKKAWGPDFQDKLEAKRAELGLGKEWLTQLAGAQPKAFLSLMGIGTSASVGTPFGVTPSGVNSVAVTQANSSGEKTQKYYKNLRATDPVKYNSKATQNEMYNQAMKLGEAFFDAP